MSLWIRGENTPWEQTNKSLNALRMEARRTKTPFYVYMYPQPTTERPLVSGECVLFNYVTAPTGVKEGAKYYFKDLDLEIRKDGDLLGDILDSCPCCGRRTAAEPMKAGQKDQQNITIVFLCIHDDHHWIRKVKRVMEYVQVD